VPEECFGPERRRDQRCDRPNLSRGPNLGAERDGRQRRRGCCEPDVVPPDAEGPSKTDVADDEEGGAGGKPDRDPSPDRVERVADRLLETGGHGDDAEQDPVVPVAEATQCELRTSR
jgi:hypothetical protein